MANTRIKGVDISAWQAGIPFDKIKAAGVDFALIRAGCGKSKDKQLDTFVAECERRGIAYGLYVYSYALTPERAKEEAEACLENIKKLKYKPTYPIYYDIEDKSQISGLTTRTRTDMCHAFCAVISAAGYKAGVYANPAWFNNFLYKKELINDYEIWLAHWTENPDRPSSYKANQRVWQWGLDHIGGYNVDGDLGFYDYATEKDAPAADPEKPAVVVPVVIERGDTVYFKGGPHYYNPTEETPVGGTRTAGLARVQNIAEGKPHEYALVPVEGGSNVYGWVDAALVAPISDDGLAVGDRVKVRAGAKTYARPGRSPISLAPFVYRNTYTVMQIGAGVAPDYIVIGVNGQVTAALHAEDLIEV